MKDIEVELKFKLPHKKTLLDFLEKNAVLHKESFQKDSYFAPSYRDFFAERPINERLRIRESNQGNSVNYKNWKEQDGKQLNYCDEYETPIEKPDQIEKIFQALDIQPVIVVNKKRKSFMYQNVEISVDEVEELGDFVELEMKGEFDSSEQAVQKLYTLSNTLGLQRDWEDNKGYPWLLLEKKGII
ncbi:MAG: class IV adenylate cyclase [Candidatus Peribacteria bacterium]|jgi:adenylate cyclase class 2|nr:class IV adenylate cyclase [Candidatus Peribacteria bacterium]